VLALEEAASQSHRSKKKSSSSSKHRKDRSGGRRHSNSNGQAHTIAATQVPVASASKPPAAYVEQNASNNHLMADENVINVVPTGIHGGKNSIDATTTPQKAQSQPAVARAQNAASVAMPVAAVNTQVMPEYSAPFSPAMHSGGPMPMNMNNMHMSMAPGYAAGGHMPAGYGTGYGYGRPMMMGRPMMPAGQAYAGRPYAHPGFMMSPTGGMVPNPHAAHPSNIPQAARQSPSPGQNTSSIYQY
jgi:hypothetical protein